MNRGYMISLLLAAALTTASPARAELTFAVASDSRGKGPSGINVPVFGAILDAMGAAKPELVFFPGDLVTGHNDLKRHRHQLTTFKRMVRTRAKVKRFYGIMGNHDSGSMRHVRLFARMFPGPKNGPKKYARLTYHLRWKGSLFVVLTTDFYGELGLVSDQQLRWLERVLTKNHDAQHIFVFAHQPAYPAGRHVGMSLDAWPEQRDRLWDLLRKHRVDAYFCGHEHFYNMKVVSGIYQVILGSAGARLYRGFGGEFHHWARVTVNGPRVSVKVFDHQGKQRRAFAFKRRSANQMLSLADVQKLPDARIIAAIRSGAHALAWKAAWVAGRRKLRAAVPAIVKTGLAKIDWKSHDDAYFLIHGVRAIRLMGARNGRPLVQALLELDGTTFRQEAMAAREALKASGKKHK